MGLRSIHRARACVAGRGVGARAPRPGPPPGSAGAAFDTQGRRQGPRSHPFGSARPQLPYLKRSIFPGPPPGPPNGPRKALLGPSEGLRRGLRPRPGRSAQLARRYLDAVPKGGL
eukprot:scaffold382_cov380-Prasinococcus_capsulatus_cf.AAC.9